MREEFNFIPQQCFAPFGGTGWDHAEHKALLQVPQAPPDHLSQRLLF
jgi:hypothetical protein